MARMIFPSFHYERDAWRAAIVRNSWRAKGVQASGFRDSARWEQVKRAGEQAVKDWIEAQLSGASVTVVLIGSETYKRDWVHYEIERSQALRMGIVGVRIHRLRNQSGATDSPGLNPLDRKRFDTRSGGFLTPLSGAHRTYDYVADNGNHNLGRWIEEAARNAGR